MLPGEDKESSYSLTKQERIRSGLIFQQLLRENQSFFVYPFKCFYLVSPRSEIDNTNTIGISIPKKKLKKAVDRNRMKRIIKEVYRIHYKNRLDYFYGQKNIRISFLLVYVSQKKENFDYIDKKMDEIIKLLLSLDCIKTESYENS